MALGHCRALAVLLLALALTTACVAPTAARLTPAPSPTAPPAPNPTLPVDRVVTLDDNNKSITVAVGQRMLLSLGEFYDWSVTPADPGIVSRILGVPDIRGSQGLYEAHRPGRTTISATGDPVCRKVTPPCAAPSLLFQLEVVVK